MKMSSAIQQLPQQTVPIPAILDSSLAPSPAPFGSWTLRDSFAEEKNRKSCSLVNENKISSSLPNTSQDVSKFRVSLHAVVHVGIKKPTDDKIESFQSLDYKQIELNEKFHSSSANSSPCSYTYFGSSRSENMSKVPQSEFEDIQEKYSDNSDGSCEEAFIHSHDSTDYLSEETETDSGSESTSGSRSTPASNSSGDSCSVDCSWSTGDSSKSFGESDNEDANSLTTSCSYESSSNRHSSNLTPDESPMSHNKSETMHSTNKSPPNVQDQAASTALNETSTPLENFKGLFAESSPHHVDKSPQLRPLEPHSSQLDRKKLYSGFNPFFYNNYRQLHDDEEKVDLIDRLEKEHLDRNGKAHSSASHSVYGDTQTKSRPVLSARPLLGAHRNICHTLNIGLNQGRRSVGKESYPPKSYFNCHPIPSPDWNLPPVAPRAIFGHLSNVDPRSCASSMGPLWHRNMGSTQNTPRSPEFGFDQLRANCFPSAQPAHQIQRTVFTPPPTIEMNTAPRTSTPFHRMRAPITHTNDNYFQRSAHDYQRYHFLYDDNRFRVVRHTGPTINRSDCSANRAAPICYFNQARAEHCGDEELKLVQGYSAHACSCQITSSCSLGQNQRQIPRNRFNPDIAASESVEMQNRKLCPITRLFEWFNPVLEAKEEFKASWARENHHIVSQNEQDAGSQDWEMKSRRSLMERFEKNSAL